MSDARISDSSFLPGNSNLYEVKSASGPQESTGNNGVNPDQSITDKSGQQLTKQQDQMSEKDREKLKEQANKLFEVLDTGLALKFHEKSGKWYAVIENKITHDVIKEVPPQYMLDLEVKLRDMIGLFLDKKL